MPQVRPRTRFRVIECSISFDGMEFPRTKSTRTYTSLSDARKFGRRICRYGPEPYELPKHLYEKFLTGFGNGGFVAKQEKFIPATKTRKERILSSKFIWPDDGPLHVRAMRARSKYPTPPLA